MIEVLEKYFPYMTAEQKQQFEKLGILYPEWNAKINVISRKDIDNLMTNHILHSLSIGKFLSPVDDTTFIDIGTGGGFPGIPMAVMYPQCRFHLIDRIGKKINVASSIAKEIGLTNVTFQHGDLSECHEKFDFAISRAVMKLPDLLKISRANVARRQPRNVYPNGLIVLKGGDLHSELDGVRADYLEEDLSLWFHEPYFETKKLIYVPF
ncbi:MAG: 16S rRNA (guanine(527)-N(7))-methyltransferase RsmG [Muribaculaceae bacterium]|nr:16S rRNA (guanine(527)-N(7))-methyltransferase RsmG [Muribaculaceae bacterium]MDE6610101.1 16S rRNA (guanine(527)-N(7))-methyltransferase RsmG [Muribaculaceae bacterium]